MPPPSRAQGTAGHTVDGMAGWSAGTRRSSVDSGDQRLVKTPRTQLDIKSSTRTSNHSTQPSAYSFRSQSDTEPSKHTQVRELFTSQPTQIGADHVRLMQHTPPGITGAIRLQHRLLYTTSMHSTREKSPMNQTGTHQSRKPTPPRHFLSCVSSSRTSRAH